MKKKIFSLLPMMAFASLLLIHNSIEPLPLGSSIPNPDLKMKDISGKEISLAEAKTDKGLLVMFSCNTCPFVIKNQARTAEACKTAMGYGIGVAILNSNEGNRSGADSYEAMKEYAKKQGYGWNYLVDKDSKLADAFGANRTPECFLFNKDGKLVYHGAIDDNPSDASAVTRKHLVTALEELRDGREITVKESRSVGCGIKRAN